MARWIRVACAVGAIGTGASGAAQEPFPMITVGGESDDDRTRACQFSYDSAIAHVESVLRQNRVRIGTRNDYVANRSIKAYINVNTQPINYESGRSSGTCVAAVSLSLEGGAFVDVPLTGHRHWAILEYCDRASLLTWRISELQTATNNVLGGFMNECLSEYTATIEPADSPPRAGERLRPVAEAARPGRR